MSKIALRIPPPSLMILTGYSKQEVDSSDYIEHIVFPAQNLSKFGDVKSWDVMNSIICHGGKHCCLG